MLDDDQKNRMINSIEDRLTYQERPGYVIMYKGNVVLGYRGRRVFRTAKGAKASLLRAFRTHYPWIYDPTFQPNRLVEITEHDDWIAYRDAYVRRLIETGQITFVRND
jgi:hypothetical protein